MSICRDVFDCMLRIVEIWRERVHLSTPKRAMKRKRDDRPEDGGGRNRSARKSKAKEPVMNALEIVANSAFP